MIFGLQLKGDKSYHYFIFSLIVYELHLSYTEKKLLNFYYTRLHPQLCIHVLHRKYICKKGHSI